MKDPRAAETCGELPSLRPLITAVMDLLALNLARFAGVLLVLWAGGWRVRGL